ncbi:MAG TPA: aerial mycelium formation protein [Actinomycetota bacterium]|nr:aerial mycelium formation protein [Actinomycetota bacterium]
MSDTPKAGGNRRIDQVLEQGFTEDLGAMDTDEVRRRRDLARGEREYLSFLRRLLQGRRDLLRDELDRRKTGGERQPVVERVVSVMSEGTRGPSRGEAPVMPLPEDEIAMARRRVERLVSDAHLSDLEALSDDELGEAVGRIDQEEREVSDARGRVIEVHDVLQEEMKRRLRAELGGRAT